MEVTRSTLMFNVKTPVQVGELKMKVISQVCVYMGKNGIITKDVDFMDHEDVTYHGVPLENTYSAWRKFVDFHKEMGIDFNKLVDEATEKAFDSKKLDLLVAEMLPDTLESVIK